MIYEPHSFTMKIKGIPWPWCAHCGLLALKNAATALAIKLGCNWRDK